MKPSTLPLHRRRFRRMLDDLDIAPASLLPTAAGEVREESQGSRVLVPALGNQTLAEGIVSAIKIAAALIDGEDGRERLPARRAREVLEVTHVWSPATAQEIAEPLLLSVGRYADGRVGEVFIDGLEEGRGKVSARTTALRQDVATLVSIALQYGAPLDVLRAAMGRAEVNVMGEVQHLPHTLIGTVLDALTGEEGA